MSGEEKPVQKAVAGWIETKSKVELVGYVLGAVVSLGTIMSFFIGVGIKLAKDDFMTVQASREMEARLEAHLTQELKHVIEVQAVKDEATSLQIARMAEDSRQSNQNIEAKLNEFTRTLIQWSRGR